MKDDVTIEVDVAPNTATLVFPLKQKDIYNILNTNLDMHNKFGFHMLDAPEEIKEVGLYNIQTRLHGNLKKTIKFWVVAKNTYPLKVGESYFQKYCKVFLIYRGYGHSIGGWHDFYLDGKLYNQLRDHEIKDMFDFERKL